LFSLASAPAPRLAKPTLAKEDRTTKDAYNAASRNYVSNLQADYDGFLAASGTLTQFNAIMVAIQGSILPTAAGVLKITIASALLLHLMAAFLLCWASRPVAEKRNNSSSLEAVAYYRRAEDTFRNYRRGWRTTLLALTASSAVAIMFVLHAYGIEARALADVSTEFLMGLLR
jgi:hypothetical protein